MKKLNEPLNMSDLKPPTYKEITGIINNLKSSGSPCPHDQMNIILKRLSLIQNRIYNFLLKNQFIESNRQKGFLRAISGTIEHTQLLTHIIKHAKINSAR